jgi:hypothetical protein
MEEVSLALKKNKKGQGVFHDKLVSLKMPTSLYEEAVREASKRRWSFCEYIRYLIEKDLKKKAFDAFALAEILEEMMRSKNVSE